MSLFSKKEILQLLLKIPQWKSNIAKKKITRIFLFKDFLDAMKFVNKIAILAETMGHHPNILIVYNKVIITLSTHDIGGLSKKDFILAKKIDKLLF